MARYRFQAADTSEARATQACHAQNRVAVIRPVFACLGGRLECVYSAFGEYDVVVPAEMPDKISATAIALATTASGAFKIVMTAAADDDRRRARGHAESQWHRVSVPGALAPRGREWLVEDALPTVPGDTVA